LWFFNIGDPFKPNEEQNSREIEFALKKLQTLKCNGRCMHVGAIGNTLASNT